MNSNRKISIIVGILFLIALVLGIVGRSIYEPILSAPDFLIKAYPNKTLIIIGIFLKFICAPAMIFISIMLFPILRQQNEKIALGYFGFRLLESIVFIIGIINSLSLISLSQKFLEEGSGNAACLQTLGNSIQAEIDWITLIYIIVFTIGAMMLYYLLYMSKLLPQFISIWGFAAAALLLAGAMLGLFGIINTSKVMLFVGPPIALNEITLAIWLIVKGFNPSTKTEIHQTH